jgi:hypothetical protein
MRKGRRGRESAKHAKKREREPTKSQGERIASHRELREENPTG